MMAMSENSMIQFLIILGLGVRCSPQKTESRSYTRTLSDMAKEIAQYKKQH
jgi:hypothetical protein